MDDLDRLSALAGIPPDLVDIIAALSDKAIRPKFLIAYQRRTALQQSQFQQTARLNEQLEGLIIQHQQRTLSESVQKEWQKDLADILESIETMLYVLIGQSGGDIAGKINEVKDTTLEKQLLRWHKTLAIFEEQRAELGTMVPPNIIHEIEYAKEQIWEVEKRLERLRK